MPLDCIKYRLDLCHSKREEIYLSVFARITAATLGILALFIFAYILSHAPWYQPANFAILSVGIGLLIASAMLKCVKREPNNVDAASTVSQSQTMALSQMHAAKKTSTIRAFLQVFLPKTPVKVDFLEVLPNEIVFKCVSDLTPYQKSLFAQVCQQAQRVAEDPSPLMKHYLAGHELTLKQLLIIADHAEDEQLKLEIKNKIEDLKEFRQSLLVESKTILEIIENLKINEKKVTLKYRWYKHFAELKSLEWKLLDSVEVKFHKIPLMQIMIKHIELMKSQGLKFYNQLDIENFPPLHMAAFHKCEILIRALVQTGADPNLRDYYGTRPLHWVVSDDSSKEAVNCLRALLELGADPNLNCESYDMGVRFHSPLWEAASNGHDEKVKVLVEFGANIDFQANSHLDVTPLLTAAYEGHLSTVKLLISLGANPLIKNSKGQTAAEDEKFIENLELFGIVL